jgi:hypothetical protein
MSIEAIKAIQMVYANTTKHDWPDDIWDAICQAIEAEKQSTKCVTSVSEVEPVAQHNVCIECRNADSWGLPDKPICRECVRNSKWQPLNESSTNPLYTRPPVPQGHEPKREPLTDETRNWIVATCPTPRHIIDAVERMHDIKGKA